MRMHRANLYINYINPSSGLNAFAQSTPAFYNAQTANQSPAFPSNPVLALLQLQIQQQQANQHIPHLKSQFHVDPSQPNIAAIANFQNDLNRAMHASGINIDKSQTGNDMLTPKLPLTLQQDKTHNFINGGGSDALNPFSFQQAYATALSNSTLPALVGGVSPFSLQNFQNTHQVQQQQQLAALAALSTASNGGTFTGSPLEIQRQLLMMWRQLSVNGMSQSASVGSTSPSTTVSGTGGVDESSPNSCS